MRFNRRQTHALRASAFRWCTPPPYCAVPAAAFQYEVEARAHERVEIIDPPIIFPMSDERGVGEEVCPGRQRRLDEMPSRIVVRRAVLDVNRPGFPILFDIAGTGKRNGQSQLGSAWRRTSSESRPARSWKMDRR